MGNELDNFLSDFKKSTNKMAGVSDIATPPEFYIDTGNYCLNKLISGDYLNGGWAQGRLAGIAGPSASGKSFLAGNAIKIAQDLGYGIFIIDSENALDETYLGNMGVDLDNPLFLYRGVTGISQAIEVFSKFTKAFRSTNMKERFLFLTDSLDMLMTDSEVEKYEKRNTIGGDQGQQAKQLKKMLQVMMHDIKNLPIAGLMTKQVYKNQDPVMQKQEPYIFTDALKFAFSQILQISRLFLKDDKTKNFEGITLRAFGYKTRFAKPYQQIKIEVPYDTGMDKYSGILDAAEYLGIVEKNGGWYSYQGQKFQKGTFEQYANDILLAVAENDSNLNVEIEEDDYDPENKKSRKSTLEEKLKQLSESEED